MRVLSSFFLPIGDQKIVQGYLGLFHFFTIKILFYLRVNKTWSCWPRNFLTFHKILNKKILFYLQDQKNVGLLDKGFYGFFHYLCTITV